MSGRAEKKDKQILRIGLPAGAGFEINAHAALLCLMSLLLEPVYVATVLCLLVALSEWLARRKFFSYLGSALIVILAAAILANLRLLPSSQNAPPLYDGVFNYLAPLAIFFLLLDVKLKDLRQAGLPMLLMFGIGAVGTMLGSFAGYYLIAPQQHGVEKAVRGRGHVHRHLHRREREPERGRAAIRGDEKRHPIRRDQRRR